MYMSKFSPSLSTEEEADQGAVARLERSWEKLFSPDAEVDAMLAELEEEWGPAKAEDPVMIPVDLLSPLGLDRKETVHTQALSYLLDPAAEHGLGDGPLREFLDYLVREMDPTDADRLLEAIGSDLRSAVLLAERAAVTGQDEEAAVVSGRTDLWIEIPDKKPRAIIVIELKVDAEARPGQLKAYDAFLQERIRDLEPAPRLARVYLTPSGGPAPDDAHQEGWVNLGLMHLAFRWLRLLDGPRKPGTEFLRLYLATLLQKISIFRFTEKPSRTEREMLIGYLRIRLGKVKL